MDICTLYNFYLFSTNAVFLRYVREGLKAPASFFFFLLCFIFLQSYFAHSELSPFGNYYSGTHLTTCMQKTWPAQVGLK